MTTGAIVVLVLGIVAFVIFGIYAANHLEDDTAKKPDNKQHS